MKEALTFDDIALVPQFNNISSRTEPKTTTLLTKDKQIEIPIIASNMDSVIGKELAKVLVYQGTVPIFHRFCSELDQSQFVKEFEGNCFISCGVNPNYSVVFDLFDKGALGVCIDVAHGHSQDMITTIKTIKDSYPNKQIIAGNVCTALAVHDLANAGADAVKVGIGGGAACTTRMVTGFGCPQFSAIQECAYVGKKLKIPIIADGGIRSSRDVVLALAAGASSVMVGSLFAKTYESSAKKVEKEDGTYAVYRGQASQLFQDEYFGGVKQGTVPEGIHFEAKCTGSALDLIRELIGGLRSGMTYGGARSIKELQDKAEFVRVTSNYLSESAPRKG